MQVQELPDYSIKSDEELMLLAIDQDELTPQARESLAVEMSKRNLHGEEADIYKREVEEARRTEEIAQHQAEIRSWFLKGAGKARYGKADVEYNPDTNVEEFTTTFFIHIFGLPLVPMGTYRVKKRRSTWDSDLTYVDKLRFDWEQILRVWVASAGILLFAIWALKLWMYFDRR